MIELKELSFGYRASAPLFAGLNLEISSGGIYGLLGKNGAGKTTLLKLITGLLFSKGGDCRVMEMQPRRRLPEFLQEIYMIPEEFYVPAISTESFERLYAPFYPRFDSLQFKQYLDEFELDGQKKKFLLAFGLATRCKLLILDEPTNGLDIPTKSQFRRFLAAAMDENRCFIISTHQVRDMEQLIDPVIIIDEGEIVFNQAIDQVSRHLSFNSQSTPPEGDVLYSEKGLGGYTVVQPNTTGDDSRIDLEILFNTVMANKSRIKQIFAKGGSS